MACIEPAEINSCLQQWLQSIREAPEASSLITIDGKHIKSSYDTAKQQSAIHVLTAFATQQGICLQQVKTSDKSNEIKKVQELLNLLSIEQCIICIDAMGCQRQIAQKNRR